MAELSPAAQGIVQAFDWQFPTPHNQDQTMTTKLVLFANLAAFPVTGEAGKLYIALNTNKQYRWAGSTYQEINPSPGSTDAIPEGSVNLYHTTLDDILKERGNRYGKFSKHAHVTQEFKLLYDRMRSSYGTSDGAKIEADQREAMDMIFHKIGRIVCGDPNYSDSWRDIAGYARLVADRLDGVEQ